MPRRWALHERTFARRRRPISRTYSSSTLCSSRRTLCRKVASLESAVEKVHNKEVVSIIRLVIFHGGRSAVSESDSADKAPSSSYEADTPGEEDASPIVARLKYVSPGVQRIEAISSVITRTDRILLLFWIFLVAYAYGLDGLLRYAYAPYATASYSQHSLLSTVSVLRNIIAAAAQPTAAKVADVFGRAELVGVSIIFYVVGTIVTAVSTNVQQFAGGTVLYQIGYTMMIFLLEVIIADITSTRARLMGAFVPNLPFLINTWVSGNITQTVLANLNWNWGIGMFAIIFTVCAMPLMIHLMIIGRRAKKQGRLAEYKTTFQQLGPRGLATYLFWQLDVIGILLLIAVFALVLTPLTLAGGFIARWRSVEIIAPLVVGIICVPLFIIWELRAPHPLAPFRLIADRAVWAAFGIACFNNFTWSLQANYLFTVLQVAFDFSVGGATRVASLYTFVSVLTGCILGFVVFHVRRHKYFIVFGTCLSMVSFGLLVHFRGGISMASQSGVIGAQILLGIASGFYPYPTMVALQVVLEHEHLSTMTALYLAIQNVGSAFGNTVAGAIWSQVLPSTLDDRLSRFGNETLSSYVYGNPFGAILEYPTSTEIRMEIIGAYQHVQRLLCITALGLVVPLIVFSLFLRNPRLTDEQTLAKVVYPGREDRSAKKGQGAAEEEGVESGKQSPSTDAQIR